ncbi:conserved hypothetical protein [Neospora caninum Liverpool]|uniref:Uncharacterized protein n=1 Tax=Neospora caninum (strain Liverpool) TaxID=572307 RepID=F0V9V7_NEOCL|nr:conserved hypothetical protein [Neospora caninum Liverpool]CBZ50719.1 conserved hypothetical protein [Neospora caninum Liverpool]CEL65330.1 TPA: hypothetical protein BN1204_011860 [Neospora caninum Liverpool]|eukprot:XP_003880752.1 conserved hypothetical protein [Neospora caninum Liverpool]
MAELSESQLVLYEKKREGTEEQVENKDSATLAPFKNQVIFKKFLAAGVISLPLRTYEQPGGDEEAARNRTTTQVAKVITEGELRRLDLLPTLLLLFPCPTFTRKSVRSAPSRPSPVCLSERAVHGKANYHSFVAAQPLPQQAILLRGAATVLLQQWILLSDDAALLSRRVFRLERQALKKVRFFEDGKPGSAFLPNSRNVDCGLWGIEEDEAQNRRKHDKMGTSKSRRKRARTRETDEREALLAFLNKKDQEPTGKRKSRGVIEEKGSRILDSLGDSLNINDSQDDGYPNYEFDYDAIMERLREQRDARDAADGSFLEKELRKMEDQKHASGPYGASLQLPSGLLFPDDERTLLDTSFSDESPFFSARWTGYREVPCHDPQTGKAGEGVSSVSNLEPGREPDRYRLEKLRGVRERPLSLTLPVSPSKLGRLQTTTSHGPGDDEGFRDDARDGYLFDLKWAGRDKDAAEGKAQAGEDARYREEVAREVSHRAFALDGSHLSRWGEVEIDTASFAGDGIVDAGEWTEPPEMHMPSFANGPAEEKNSAFPARGLEEGTAARRLALPSFSLEDSPLREDPTAEQNRKRPHSRETRVRGEGTGSDALNHETGKAGRKVLWDRVAFATPGIPPLLSPSLSLSEKQMQWKQFWSQIASQEAQIHRSQSLTLWDARFHLLSPSVGLLQCDPVLSLLALHTDLAASRPEKAVASRARLLCTLAPARDSHLLASDGDRLFSAAHRREQAPNASIPSAFPCNAFAPAAAVAAHQWRCSWEEASRTAFPGFLKHRDGPHFFRSFAAEPEHAAAENHPASAPGTDDLGAAGEDSFLELRSDARKPAQKSAASSTGLLARLGTLPGSREAADRGLGSSDRENGTQAVSTDGIDSSEYVEILRGLFDSSSLTQGAYTPHEMRSRQGKPRDSSQLLRQCLYAGPSACAENPSVASSSGASESDRVSDDLFFDGDFVDRSAVGDAGEQDGLRKDVSSVSLGRGARRSEEGREETDTPHLSPRLSRGLSSLSHPGGDRTGQGATRGFSSDLEKQNPARGNDRLSRDTWQTSGSSVTLSSFVSSSLPVSSGSTRDGSGEGMWQEGGQRDTTTRTGFRSFLYALLRRRVLLSHSDSKPRDGEGHRSLLPDSDQAAPHGSASWWQDGDARAASKESKQESGEDDGGLDAVDKQNIVSRLTFHEVVPQGRVRPSTAAKAFQHLLALYSRGEILLRQKHPLPFAGALTGDGEKTRSRPETLFICGTRDLLFGQDPRGTSRSAEREPGAENVFVSDTEKRTSDKLAGGRQWVVCA